MGGKRLEPFQLESVTIGLRTEDAAGDETIDGRVVFRNDEGIESSQSIEPVLIRVLQPQALELESEQASSAFAFLIDAFNKDYVMHKQPLEQSGWRSLSQVAEGAKISASVLYGSEGKYGRPVYELLLRGLIEKRVFTQHRGRGGEAVKVRVSYDREPVRRIRGPEFPSKEVSGPAESIGSYLLPARNVDRRLRIPSGTISP